MTLTIAVAAHDDLIDSYRAVRARSEALAAPLSDEDCVLQSMPDASPAKWHLAHVTWFFETLVLQPHADGYAMFHPRFGYLFNSYYESLGPRHERPRRGMLSRPSRAEVMAYRRHVDDAIERLLAGTVSPAVRDLIKMGLNHEQQHQELLLMDIKHALSCNPLQPAYQGVAAAEPAVREAVELQWRPLPGGRHAIGASPDNGFAYDNETPRHDQWLEPCRIASRPVTCGEYLEFMADAGYATPALWLSEGWARVQSEGWSAPLYWQRRDDGWWRFTLHGPQPVHPAEPVSHISYYEADAFARWAGARLPREAEWEVFACERDAYASVGEHLEPAALGAEHPAAAADFVPAGVWEWTQSAYAPYPGFRAAAGALGEYNGKFMCSQLVLRGGCCATPAGHARPTYRNFYYPQQRWMFAGLRLAQDA